jgi:limonene-1,2-epoxide hydrolase
MAAGRRIAAALVVIALLAGCGRAAKTTTTVADPPPAPQRSELDPPASIPDRATGPATKEARQVITAWLRALRRGDVQRAARYFALPSKFQNSTPVLTVHTKRERIAVNLSLPCGAKAREMGAAGVYTIVTFVLTKRPGGNCGTGVGGTARGAIRVERRHIKEWYRLPDEPSDLEAGPSA